MERMQYRLYSLRERLIAEHDVLRRLSIGILALARTQRRHPDGDITALVLESRLLLQVLDDHILKEELLLKPVLLEMNSRLAARAARMSRDHQFQLQRMQGLKKLLSDEAADALEIASEMECFCGWLIRDMDAEEDELLGAVVSGRAQECALALAVSL